ncbi:hypothetical protein PG993_004359 [Apiospora rasikravindrae]|uniref:Uncharacterized protein n=1 Tax=Apiospora rasikravindrae TaxID=990691 RepID=A0ABR1TCJ7_9PEZI
MCLTLFTHHCSVGHETRPLCTLNPATNCTVSNPYAEPLRNPCLTPCSRVLVNFENHCGWHGRCCRLVRTPMCGAFDPRHCPNNVAYHQRKEPTATENDGENDMAPPLFPPLPEFNEELWFVALRWDFFQAGTDLHSVAERGPHYAAAMDRAKAKSEAEDDDAAARRRESFQEARKGYVENHRKYQHMALYLGQLARVWDRNAKYGLCPPRPGRRPDPALAWPAYAQVDPDQGVWSIGYELARNVASPAVKPPARQEVFERHYVPRRVGVPNFSYPLPLAAPMPFAVVQNANANGSELASASPLQVSGYPVPPVPPTASDSTIDPSVLAAPSTKPQSPPSIPRHITPEDPSAGKASQLSLEQYLAQQDAEIDHQIVVTGLPQKLFGRYLEQNNISHNHNGMIPDDGLIRQWDPVMRDRVAAARDEVMISPQSSTMVRMPRAGEMETQRVEVGVRIKRESAEVKMEDVS